jgi:hypothetical protein
MWKITDNAPKPVGATGDCRAWLYPIEQDDERRTVVVELSGTLVASGVELLPSPLDQTVRTHGASELARTLAEGGEPPARLKIHSNGATVVEPI